MRTLRILIVCLMPIFVAGCWVLSIDPLYTSEDLVYEPSLVGIWGDPEGKSEETWTFLPRDDKAYRLITKEEGAPDAVFEVHLLRLGDHLLMDMFPEEPEVTNEFHIAHLIPAHSFWTVSLEGHTLVLDVIAADRLEEMIDSAVVDIDHVRRDGAIVLTAPTKDLQSFVLKHIDRAVSGDPFVLNRVH